VRSSLEERRGREAARTLDLAEGADAERLAQAVVAQLHGGIAHGLGRPGATAGSFDRG